MEFAPTPTQKGILDWWCNSDAKYTLICGGERAGKSYLAAAMMAQNLLEPGMYWIVGPDYLQTRAEFTYLHDALAKGNMLAEKASMPAAFTVPWRMVTRWGAEIVTRSSGEITKLASFSVNGIIMAEAAQQNHAVWLKLMGRVSETNGFIILSGTLENGEPWYEDMLKRWRAPTDLGAKAFTLPTWSNTVIYPGGRDDPKIQALELEYPPDLFMERFGAEPRRYVGTVIPEFDFATHVQELEVQKDAPVEIAVDPGKMVYAVLFVQRLGMFTHVLDEVYTHGKIVHEVIPLVMGNPLWQYVDTGDAGVIDIAGTQEHANHSQTSIWLEMAGVNFRHRYTHERTLIDTIRFRMSNANIQHEPLVYFSSKLSNDRTPDGQATGILSEMELWRWPQRRFKRSEPRSPIDSNNHAVKALGYYLVDRFGPYKDKVVRRRTVQQDYWMTMGA